MVTEEGSGEYISTTIGLKMNFLALSCWDPHVRVSLVQKCDRLFQREASSEHSRGGLLLKEREKQTFQPHIIKPKGRTTFFKFGVALHFYQYCLCVCEGIRNPWQSLSARHIGCLILSFFFFSFSPKYVFICSLLAFLSLLLWISPIYCLTLAMALLMCPWERTHWHVCFFFWGRGEGDAGWWVHLRPFPLPAAALWRAQLRWVCVSDSLYTEHTLQEWLKTNRKFHQSSRITHSFWEMLVRNAFSLLHFALMWARFIIWMIIKDEKC